MQLVLAPEREHTKAFLTLLVVQLTIKMYCYYLERPTEANVQVKRARFLPRHQFVVLGIAPCSLAWAKPPNRAAVVIHQSRYAWIHWPSRSLHAFLTAPEWSCAHHMVASSRIS
jgi:hypothetical protein